MTADNDVYREKVSPAVELDGSVRGAPAAGEQSADYERWDCERHGCYYAEKYGEPCLGLLCPVKAERAR